MPFILLVSSFAVHAQIKNAKTITARVSGNCGMCESIIEKAGTVDKEAKVDWDKDSNIATITYNTQKTDSDQILKRIALAGYDNEKYLAPDETYSNLHGCCQYERQDKDGVAAVEVTAGGHTDHGKMQHENGSDVVTQTGSIDLVLNSYFRLEEALVKSDSGQAALLAGTLQKTIKTIDMSTLTAGEHKTWMQVAGKLSDDVSGIANTSDLKKQRALFSSLSENLYTLATTADLSKTIYYNNCPMFNDGKGANWLSSEKVIRNPYYGNQMLSCGKVIETID